MTVRQLRPDADAAAWRDIRLEMLEIAADAFDSPLAEWRDRPLADFAARLATPVFAAMDGPRALAVAGWERDWDARDPARGWVVSVYARPEVRGRGVIREVLAAVAHDARAAGMTSLGLNVVATNLRAQALYRALGYRDSGRQGVVNRRGVPEIEMLAPLAP